MSQLPRLRWSGDPARRNVAPLLGLAAVLLVAKLPLGFVALAVMALVVVAVHGVQRRFVFPRPLRWLIGWCVLAGLLSGLTSGQPASLASTSSHFVWAVVPALVCLAVLATGNPERTSRWLLNGLVGGLLTAWAIAMFEVASGFKFMTVLYPDANTIKAVSTNRFYVSALFPNYNDFSVAMVMLSLVVVAGLLFDGRAHPRVQLARWAVLASNTFLITHMGSRGSLLALIVGVTLLVVTAIRVVRPRALGVRSAVLSFLVVVCGGLGLFHSPWVQDNSALTRGIIARKISEMWAADPWHMLVGWPTMSAYQDAATLRYGKTLMDPHNLLLEFAVRFGVPAMVLYLLITLVIIHGAFVRRAAALNWRQASVLTLAAVLPVLGIVTSSTLRHHLVWLWLLLATLALRELPRPRRSPSQVSAIEDA